MTDKQINIVEILAEQCKECTLHEGDTISLNFLMFDRPLEGICFNNNIYFSADKLNYIMQKLISKEQECDMWKNLTIDNGAVALKHQQQLDQLKEQLEAYKMEAEEGKEINAELKAENEELKKCYKNNSALLDFEETNTTKIVNKVMKLEKTLTEIKELCKRQDLNQGSRCIHILQKISEVEDV